MPTLTGLSADQLWGATEGGLIPGPTVQSDLWPLPINWRAEWRESYEFNTEVLVSRDQHEQRRALRVNPRVHYEFLSTVRDREAGQQARRRLAERQSKSWVIPHGRFWVRLASDVAQGATAFTLEEDPSWVAVGREVVFRRKQDAELGTIATYAAGSGTLEAPAKVLIPAGTPVHLGVRGRFDTKAQFRLATVSVGEIPVTFLAEPGGHYVPPAGAANPTYNGKEVWTVRPNWARSLSIDFEAFQDVIDHGFGVRGYVDPVDYVARTFQAEFQMKDSADLAALYGLFVRSVGKRTDFYMPAWNKEIVPSTITTAEMTVTGDETARLLGLDPSHRHVALFLKDGSTVLRAVSLVASGGGDTIFVFDSSISSVSLSDIHYVTWLLPTRFFSDHLQLDWVTNTAAVATVSLLTLRDESP